MLLKLDHAKTQNGVSGVRESDWNTCVCGQVCHLTRK
jgi:hypothetical protein